MVSQLEEMSSGQLSDEDVIMISDISEKKSLKITVGMLKKEFAKSLIQHI